MKNGKEGDWVEVRIPVKGPQQGTRRERNVAWARQQPEKWPRGSQWKLMGSDSRREGTTSERHHLEKHSVFQRQVTAGIKHSKV